MPGSLPPKLDCLAQERRGSGMGAGRLRARTGEERPRAEKGESGEGLGSRKAGWGEGEVRAY